MASLIVESKMWQILLLSICSASLKFVAAEDIGQVVRLAKSPLPAAPLVYYYRPITYPTGALKVPLTYYKLNQPIQTQQPSSDCPQLETLESILALLKRILNKDDDAYVSQPDKRIQILQTLNEFLEKSGTNAAEVDSHQKLKELIARTDKAVLVENEASHSEIYDPNKKNHVEANVIFKYDIPATNNVDCKEAMATLIQTVKNAHLQVTNYCIESGKCKFNPNLNPNPLGIQRHDKPDNLQTTLTLDNVNPTQTKITTATSNLSNIKEIGNSVNELIQSSNQGFGQKSSNDYLNPIVYYQENLSNNQNVADGLITGSVQTQNNRERNEGSFNNIQFNSKSQESSHLSKQQGEKANALDIFGLPHPMPPQGQITPSNQHPRNIQDVTNSLYNLFMGTQNTGDQSLSNAYLNYLIQPTNVPPNSALNTNIIQTKDRQKENIDITNTKYSNNVDRNERQKIITTPTIGNIGTNTQSIGNIGINTPAVENNRYNLMPLLQTQNVKSPLLVYSNVPNQQPYKVAQLFNDKSSSMMINQKNHNIKKQIQYGGTIVSQGFKTLISPSHIPRNQNMNVRQASPFAYSGVNTNPIHYLSSLNLHKVNNLNYNSNQAGASVQNNIGLNYYAPTNFVDYPKHDIYVASNRATSEANLVKLNSVTDNDGIVELTYKLHRPQPVTYTPYYYVKFRMPYKDFVSKINELFRNPYMRSNPFKLHKELLEMSYLAEASPDLNNIERAEVSQLILKNGGTLINAQVLRTNGSNANDYLKTIQNLNAKLNTNDILNLFDNGQTQTLHEGVPIFKPPGDELKNINPQLDPRRLFAALPHYESKPTSLSFWPAKVAPKYLLNSQPVLLSPNLHQ